MAIIDKFCPKCMNIIRRKDVKCSKCGMLVSDMIKLREKELENKKVEINNNKEKTLKKEDSKSVVELKPVVTETDDGGAIVDTSKMFANSMNQEQTSKNVEDSKNENNKSDESNQEIEFDDEHVGSVVFEEKNKPKRHKHKSKINKNDQPQFTVDEDGSYNIDTKDVTYLEGVNKPTSSIRKARGDIKEEKIEWWEIYKWADKMLARRKIKKEVNKAGNKIPKGINRGSLIAWCIFFGWLGIHNFKAGNKKKGWFIVISDLIIIPVINVPVLYKIMGVFVGGGLGFIVLSSWFLDLFALIFNKYKYRISKEEFISNLNIETRVKLNKKYVDFDKVIFKEKEEARLNKKVIKKQKKLDKKKAKLERRQQRLEERQNKEKTEKEKKPKKKKEKIEYEIVEHKMDE